MNLFINKNHIVTNIVLATQVPAGGGCAIHKNRPSHGLAFQIDGKRKYVFDDGCVCTVGENEMIYLPKNANYEVKNIENGSTYCINFQLADEQSFSPFVYRIQNVNEILKAYQTAEKAWKRAKVGREYKVTAALYSILYELRRQYAAPYLPESKQALIQPAVDYIHKRYAEELINVQNLSETCGISYDYFRKLFQRFYGCSPIKYINTLKINRAKELLSSGLYSVGEAAFLSGFFDVSHFSRFFKENVGVLPSEYSRNA